jgi:hypothetical protein
MGESDRFLTRFWSGSLSLLQSSSNHNKERLERVEPVEGVDGGDKLDSKENIIGEQRNSKKTYWHPNQLC